VVEGEPVAEGQLQHLGFFADERTSKCQMYKSDLFKVIKIGAQLERI
jgi:hypothetical protein